MEDKKPLSNIYPDATRGPLKEAGVEAPQPKRRRLFRARDYQPVTLIAFAAVGAILIGVVGTAVFYIVRERSQQTSSRDVAVAVARKLTELNATDTFTVMESRIDEELKNCTVGYPQIVLTHHYLEAGKPPRTETTIIDLRQDIASALEQAVDRSDGAARNELNVACASI